MANAIDQMSDEDIDHEFTESVLEHKAEKEAEWALSQSAVYWAWIDEEPTYRVAADWSTFFNPDGTDAFPPPAKTDCRITTLRLSGGGKIVSAELFYTVTDPFLVKHGCTISRNAWLLKVWPEDNNPDKTFCGFIYEGPHYEKNMQAVVMDGCDADLCERVAATLRSIDSDPAKLRDLLIPGS